MCGIAGCISSNADTAPVSRMVAAMHHRGPDDRGQVDLDLGSRRVSLGSTRLAIVDLSAAGHMPMKDALSGNWIAYNGEVYNFRELRRELEGAGEHFVSATDTEVVLKGYRRWGRELPTHLRGMFALAIWDAATQELFLARDRLGEKPLYYHAGNGGEFCFASEVRGLLASGSIDRQLEPGALEMFLANGFLIAPRTPVAGVRSLLPGSWMRVSGDGQVIEETQYWHPGRREPVEPSGDGGLQLEQELETAVRLRLVSDVPIGLFLSGGMDSSILAALAASAATRLRTFSVTFDEPGFDESPYSDWVARRFATDHTEVRLRREEFAGWLPSAVDALDQPSFDGLNTYCVARAAKASGLTVALSGLGADEIFGGYPFFRTVPWLGRSTGLVSTMPAGLKQGVAGLAGCRGLRVSAPWKLAEALDLEPDGRRQPLSPLLAAYQATQLLFPRWTRRELLARPRPESADCHGLPVEFRELLDAEAQAARPGNGLSLLALRLFLGERCLRDTDAMGMASSLEVRAVFTDHHFLDRALGVAPAARCAGAPHKPCLKRIFQKRLGADFPARKKQGFVLPLDTWLGSGSPFEMIREVLGDRAGLTRLGLDADAVAEVLAGYRCGRRSIPWSRVWALFVFARWCRSNRVSL